MGQLLVQHKAHEAARTIAALLHFAAVGVKNAVAKIRLGKLGSFHQQDLVATHAKMPVGQKSQLLRREMDVLAHAVYHHEIVACAMHFGEL